MHPESDPVAVGVGFDALRVSEGGAGGGGGVEICGVLGYYSASSGSVPTFRDNLSVPSSKFKKSKKKEVLDFLALLEEDTYRFSRNVCTEQPLDAE
jgi:hypothetical protein